MIALPAALLGAALAVGLGLPGANRLGAVRTRPTARSPQPRQPMTSGWTPLRAGRGRRGLLVSAGACVVAVVLVLAGPATTGALVAGAFAARRVTAARTDRAARAAERSQAVEACTVLAGELRAGRSSAEAFQAAASVACGPARRALAAAAGAAQLGGDVPSALGAGSAGSAVRAALLGLGACWSVCAATGSGVAAAVERLEQGLRAEQDQRRAVDAELAGPRATAALLAVLPLAGIGLAAALGAHPLEVLLHTGVGLVALTCGLTLDLLGLWWTGRLVNAAGGR